MPRLNHPSTRLATLGQDRQDAALRHANAACSAMDAAVVKVWRMLLRVLAKPSHFPYHPLVYGRAVDVLRLLPRELVGALQDRLKRLAWWGWRSAGAVMVEAVPKGRLADDVRDLLLAPPAPEQTAAIVFSSMPGQPPWWERIAASTRLAKPEHVGLVVASGLALGRTPREIAKELQPVLQGVQASARRVARTESMRVTHEAQTQAWEAGLGEAIIGYEIHSQKDQHTRPWHRDRDGTIYYKRPTGDQLGLDRMPRPPMESPDTRDRPAGAPSVAFNCRCWLSPVLRGAET